MKQTSSTGAASASAIFLDASEQEERELKVEGDLPEWLEGVLYRTGTGHYNNSDRESSSFEIQHWLTEKL